jgi:hypothetical protein
MKKRWWMRSYSELCTIHSFEDRYRYLRVSAEVGIATFGYERWLNQAFYSSVQWRQIRQEVIARDRGCDLGVEGYEIFDRIVIHHMNPMLVSDITSGNEAILDPEFLISVSLRTHNAIHYGDEKVLPRPLVRRSPGDTKLW